jgi:hypothetical protein
MSRTRRHKRPRFYKSAVGYLRDGADQYIASHCKHHNLCSWCRGNRTHSALRQAPA